ncbi:MAG: RsmE family RNA methyltransferase [Candidatus Cryosericum sp.]
MPAFEAGRSLRAGERVTLAGTECAHHIADVLRARHGEKITLFHDGELYDTLVDDSSKADFSVTVTATHPAPFTGHPVALVQAVIRPGLLDDIVHMCSPLGVSPFIFYSADRSQPWNVVGRLERLGQVALSAAEQAETGRVPIVELAGGLDEALSYLDGSWRVILLSPRSVSTMTALVRASALSLDGPVAIAVGPEGGFTTREEAMLEARGAVPARLSTGILRSELAGFAAGLIVRELQDS